MAMLHAIEQRRISGTIKLVGFGFNLNPEIAEAWANGRLHGWIAQLPRDVVRRAVLAAGLFEEEAVPSAIHTDFFVITKGNLPDAKVQAHLGTN